MDDNSQFATDSQRNLHRSGDHLQQRIIGLVLVNILGMILMYLVASETEDGNTWATVVSVWVLGQASLNVVIITALTARETIETMRHQEVENSLQRKAMQAQLTRMEAQEARMIEQREIMRGQLIAGQKQAISATDQLSVMREQLITMESQIEIAQRQFELTGRPWLAFSVRPVSPLTFGDQGSMSLTLSLTARNVGRSVAVNVTINARIIVAKFLSAQQQIIDEQRLVCRSVFTEVLSYVVFPEEAHTAPISFNLDGRTLEKGRSPNTHIIDLFLVGCVDYQFSGHDRHHQTRFAYEIRRKTVDFPKSIGVIMIGESVPLEHVYLQKSFIGGCDYAD
jgi:hypothetical protein